MAARRSAARGGAALTILGKGDDEERRAARREEALPAFLGEHGLEARLELGKLRPHATHEAAAGRRHVARAAPARRATLPIV